MSPFGQKFNADDVYWIADTHINHRNYCRGVSSWKKTDRCLPFNNLEEMNAAIIGSINDVVPEDKVLFLLGDFCLGKKSEIPHFRNQINCKNIHYIMGNHCYHMRKNQQLRDLFSSVQDYLEVIICHPTRGFVNTQVNMFHYPCKSWNNSHKLSWFLSGHVHGSLPYQDYEMGLDCGWNVWKKPLSYWDIKKIMDRKVWKPVCHHDQDTN